MVACQTDEHANRFAVPCKGLLLEVSTCFRLFGGANALYQQVWHALTTWHTDNPGMRLATATWATAQGAWWLAKSRPCNSLDDLMEQAAHSQQCPSCHKQRNATGEAGTSEACIGSRTGGGHYLDKLPASVLDLPVESKTLLTQCDLLQLGKLRALPRPALQRRLGPKAMQELDAGYGVNSDFRQAQAAPLFFHSQVELPFHSTAMPLIQHGMERLLDELEQWLRRRQLASDELDWTFYKPHNKQTLRLRSARFLQARKDWLPLLANKLQTTEFDDDVSDIRLECRSFQPATSANLSLLPEEGVANHNAWLETCDQLKTRLGPEIIQFVNAKPDPRPEKAIEFSTTPPGRPQAKKAHRKHHAYVPEQGSTHVLTAHAERPLWQLPKPVRLNHLASPGSQGKQRWQLLAGPERINFGWWEGSPSQRDYYRAINQDGVQAWLFLEQTGAESACWYLHGYFA